MLIARRLAGTILSVVALAQPASAGVNRWTSQGPDGGPVYAIAVDPSNPSIVYAGTYFAGVFRSDDGGLHWRALDSGISRIATIALDPSRSATVYAGGEGLYKSTDGGLSWITLMDGVPPYGQNVADLAIDASAPDTIYAATLDGVYKSVDGGCTFVAMNTGLPETNGYFYTNSITIDPTNPSTVYLGSNFIGAFKSLDAGASWFSISVGLLYPTTTMTIDPATPSRLWAANSYFIPDLGGGNGTIMKSEDGGLSWQPSNGGLPNAFYGSVLQDPNSPTTLWTPGNLGVFRSDDGGANWTSTSSGLDDLSVTALAISPGAPQTLFAGTGVKGIYRSSDGGGSWALSVAGFHASTWWSLANAASDPNVLFAAGTSFTNFDGLVRSGDGGKTWQGVGPGLTGFAGTVAVDPTNASIVYVSEYGARTPGDPTTFKSVDGGATWSPAQTGLGGTASFIAIDPTNTQRLVASTPVGFYRSSDGAASWVPATTALPYTYGVVATKDGTFYGRSDEPPDFVYVYVSVDHGDTWTKVSDGLPSSGVQSVTPDPSNAGALYVATAGGQGVFKTTDGGLSWNPLGGLLNLATSAIVVDPNDPTQLFAATQTGGTYPPVFAAAGVFRSTDGGVTWTPFNRGLDAGPPQEVFALAIGPGGPVVYAATDQGVFDHTLSAAAAPLPTSSTPIAGARDGGAVVTISGSGFQNGAEVSFGTAPAASVTFIDSGTISATTPAGAAGPADIVVRNPDTQDATLARGFVYDYDDVPPTADYYDAVVSLTHAGVTVGCGKGRFCPDLSITRAQMAVFVEKTIHGPDFAYPPPTVSFVDVFPCSPEGKYILQLGSEGATAGCGPDYFCPQAGNTRAQAAVFVLKAEHGGDYAPPPATGTVFTDVPAGAFAADFIEQLAAEGITAGCGGGLFCPEASVTRAQAAAFLSLALLPP